MKKFLGILLIWIMVLTYFMGCAKAEFEISSLNITPSKVVAGEPVVAEVDVNNIGGAEGIYTANITIDGEFIDKRDIVVASKTTERAYFTCCLEEAGTHVIELAGLKTTVTALKPAEFKIGSLSITPEEVLPNQEATVKIDVSNVGEVEGTCPANLKVDGVEVEIKEVMVAAGDSETVSFRLTEEDPGMYNINLEGRTGTLKVLKTAEFKFSNLCITPEEVKVGGEAILEADIENMGEVEGTYPVTLQVDGVEVETKEVMVAAGDSETISFHLTKEDAGMYTINLEELTGEVHFRELKPGDMKIVGDIDIFPNPVKVGEEASITITVINAGEVEDTYTARLLVDGLEEQTSDVTLAGGVKTSVGFSVSRDSPGSYNVEIGDREVTLEVFEPVRLRTGTAIVKVRKFSGGLPYIEISENDLVKDAVLVLCSSEERSIPILAVYIQSGDTPKIRHIREGTYIIYITTGLDWDDDSKIFRTDATYGQFVRATGPDELTNEFEFNESSTTYTFWQLPLKPFRLGVWSTQVIFEAEFPELK